MEGTVKEGYKEPEWYLLSYGKKVIASSFEEGKEPENAADEDSVPGGGLIPINRVNGFYWIWKIFMMSMQFRYISQMTQ